MTSFAATHRGRAAAFAAPPLLLYEARWRVRRLRREMFLVGVSRCRVDDDGAAAGAVDRPADLVERRFTATRPNQLWGSDFG